MARKKQAKKRSWLKAIFFYIFFPLTVWFLAFVAWLYWDGIMALFSKEQAKERNPPRAAAKSDKSNRAEAPAKRVQEKILDDDRKSLEAILNKRQ